MLQAAIVLLGLKLNAAQLLDISGTYALPIAGLVCATSLLGLSLGWLVRSDHSTNALISSGTAICGGTTIATLSPIIAARPEQTGAALCVVLLLNAIALITFPTIGTWLNLSQEQFGVWAALAIHDTSSVVATAQMYGTEAAEIATTVKIGRTLADSPHCDRQFSRGSPTVENPRPQLCVCFHWGLPTGILGWPIKHRGDGHW